jgi:glyoxylase-like metal-dependent hydrolase (beta-lactamase superfamily II)
VLVTGVHQREAWANRVLPDVEEVRTGVWSIPVPFPDNPLRYTLSYLLFGRSGLVIVDPGWNSDVGWKALLDGICTAGASVADVLGIVVTHIHPDHHGLSCRLMDAAGCWLGMHPHERDTLPSHLWPHDQFSDDDRAWLLRAGVTPQDVAAFDPGVFGPSALGELPEPDVLLADGDQIPLPGSRFHAVWTPGHTPGHLCVHDRDRDLLLTGDHLLPRISPNIGIHTATAGSPLSLYLESLDTTARFDSAEALPAHEYRFRGISARAAELEKHHDDRCSEIVAALRSQRSATALEVAERLHWAHGWSGLDQFMMRGAVAETIAHLTHLVGLGRVAASGVGRDEPVRYAVADHGLDGITVPH